MFTVTRKNQVLSRAIYVFLAVVVITSCGVVSLIPAQAANNLTATGTVYPFVGYNALDEPVNSITIKLDPPIQANLGSGNITIEDIQLSPASNSGIVLSNWIDKKVQVSGDAFEAHTGWHFKDVVMLASEIHEAENSGTTADISGWQNAYIDVLRNIGVVNYSWGGVESGVESVSVIDLTNDGIPELVFSNIDGYTIRFSVYSYLNGQCDRIVYIGELEHVVSAVSYDAYLTSAGNLIVRGGNGGEANYMSQFYIYRNFNTPEKINLSHDWAAQGDYYDGNYFIDGSQVTKGQYEAEIDRIYDGAEYCLINYYFTDERNGTRNISMNYTEAIQYLQASSPIVISPSLKTLTVNPTASTVYVNGTATPFEAYLINGNNYFKLRDLAYTVNGSNKQFNVGYNNATGEITLTGGQPYAPVGGEMTRGNGTAKSATLNSDVKIAKDGTTVQITAYLIDGNNFVMLRDVMRLFDIGVTWDGATSTIRIDTLLGYTD